MPSKSHSTERLFVACELDDAARAHLGPQAVALGHALHGAPVPATNLHMTLVFLGATPATELEAIHAVLRRTCRNLPPARTRQLETAGTPGRRASRIVAAVFEDPGDRFAMMATTIAAALAPRWPLTPVLMPFWPHVTLVRLRAPEPVRTISAQSEHTFAFDRVTLYASRSTPSGPARYDPLARIALTVNDRPH